MECILEIKVISNCLCIRWTTVWCPAFGFFVEHEWWLYLAVSSRTVFAQTAMHVRLALIVVLHQRVYSLVFPFEMCSILWSIFFQKEISYILKITRMFTLTKKTKEHLIIHIKKTVWTYVSFLRYFFWACSVIGELVFFF